MSDKVRMLNEHGIKGFRAFLKDLQRGKDAGLPLDLLTSPASSSAFEPEVSIERSPSGVPFKNRFEFGIYLRDKLAIVDRVTTSRNDALWNWLSLYYFDQLCPSSAEGSRKVYADEVYILSAEMSFRQYFRHLVRAPWHVISEHGQNGKVLLIHTDRGDTPLSTRGLIFEQLASRQSILSNPTIIAGAQRLFFDETIDRPHLGVSGHGAGTVRRFAIVVQQLELTFDLRSCSVEQFIALLPKEFDPWKQRTQRKAERLFVAAGITASPIA